MDDAPTHLPASTWKARSLLGVGAGGRVWLAERSGREVALKLAESPEQARRLCHEAALLARLDHPNVVGLVEAEPGGAWLALDLVRGPNLEGWARGRELPALIRVFCQLAEGLAHLHQRGLVHGDLKPGNVLLDELDRPRIIDLGTARLLAEAPSPGFHGTLGYAAPELLKGAPSTPRSDLYALGALMYQLLTGRTPFVAADPAALSFLPLTSLPEPPGSFRPRLPAPLQELVLRLLARRPDARPDSADPLPECIRKAATGPAARLVVGMARERELLRRAVVACDDGKTAAFVVHGAAGSGRGTLIDEACAAAGREGLERLHADPEEPHESLLGRLRSLGAPAVVLVDGEQPRVSEKVTRLLVSRLPVLVLVRSLRPLLTLTRLGVRHLSPPRLSLAQVQQLLTHLQLPDRDAESLWESSGGLPGALVGQLRGLDGDQRLDLDEAERELLAATASGPRHIVELAPALGLREHQLVDLAERLLDLGLLVEVEDGAALQAVSPSG